MSIFFKKSARKYVEKLLASADVQIDGGRSWDLSIKNENFFTSVVTKGSLGLGESYMDGWWECDALDVFFYKILRRKLDQNGRCRPAVVASTIKSILTNRQNGRKSFEVGERHYDAGNDLFEKMLDSRMNYSCALWHEARNLDEAQEAKLEIICRKLMLEPGMKLLDIGCGWGGLVCYAAEKFGVSAVGVTISREQARMAAERCLGLPVEIRMQDYREMSEEFDAVASVGMFEHVGYKNYAAFMSVARRCLGRNGLLLLHTIGANRSVRQCDRWFDKYIFPNGMLPSIKQIGEAIEDTFVMEDWQNIGIHYDKTLMAWYENIEKRWDTLKNKYSERFFRMWRYYLLSLAGGFRARNMQVWQVVLSPEGLLRGYPYQHPIRKETIPEESFMPLHKGADNISSELM